MEIKEFFSKMTSNTLAGRASQTYFVPTDVEKEYVGRVFYKVFSGGEYNYSFLFSSVTDSSFPIEHNTPKNTEIIGWEILSAKFGVCSFCDMENMPEVLEFQQITFNGKTKFNVNKAELFCTDEISLNSNKGDYICLEITYKGSK